MNQNSETIRNEGMITRPSLSALALFSFVISFAVARIFTSLSPGTVLLARSYHIHHFWYGIFMLAVGGWLGISYTGKIIDRVSAIIFGAGGGLIGDEAGLLLTQDYWTEITYSLVLIFVGIVSGLILLARYYKTIRSELDEVTERIASFFAGLFLAIVSLGIMIRTDDLILIVLAAIALVVGGVLIAGYFVHHIVDFARRRGAKFQSNTTSKD